MRGLVLIGWLAGCQEVPPCPELGESECNEQHECMWSEVSRYRMENGACELVRESSQCLDRQMVSAGCGSIGCDYPGPAPWYRTEADTSTLIAAIDECGSGVVEWSSCQATEDGIEPPICACACP